MMIGHSPLMHDHSEMMPSNVTSADLMWWVATQGGMVEESDVLADGGFAYGNFPILTDDSNVQHDASFVMSTHTEDGVLPNAGSSIPTRTQDRMFRDHDATSGSNSSSIPHNPSAHITSRSYRLSLVLLPGMDVEGSDEVRLDITNGGYYTMQQFHLNYHGANEWDAAIASSRYLPVNDVQQNTWYLASNGVTHGPYTEQDMQRTLGPALQNMCDYHQQYVYHAKQTKSIWILVEDALPILFPKIQRSTPKESPQKIDLCETDEEDATGYWVTSPTRGRHFIESRRGAMSSSQAPWVYSPGGHGHAAIKKENAQVSEEVIQSGDAPITFKLGARVRVAGLTGPKQDFNDLYGTIHSHDNDKGMYVVQWDYPFKSSDHIKVILYVPVCSCFPDMCVVYSGQISVPCCGA